MKLFPAAPRTRKRSFPVMAGRSRTIRWLYNFWSKAQWNLPDSGLPHQVSSHWKMRGNNVQSQSSISDCIHCMLILRLSLETESPAFQSSSKRNAFRQMSSLSLPSSWRDQLKTENQNQACKLTSNPPGIMTTVLTLNNSFSEPDCFACKLKAGKRLRGVNIP